MAITDFEVAKEWAKIPKNIWELLLNKAFCSNCGETTIVNNTMHGSRFDFLLEDKCKKCDKGVARLVEKP